VCDPYIPIALYLQGRSLPKGRLAILPELVDWHSCFVCASDTVVITGQPVDEPSEAYAPGRMGTASSLVQPMTRDSTAPETMIRASADAFFGYFLDAWSQSTDAIPTESATTT
jgi:hypothetical protein